MNSWRPIPSTVEQHLPLLHRAQPRIQLGPVKEQTSEVVAQVEVSSRERSWREVLRDREE